MTLRDLETIAEAQFGHGRPWTTNDEGYLRSMADLGADAIADHLGRSTIAVRKRAQKLGVSLRPPGERRGRLLGLPNGTAGLRVAVARIERHHRIRAMVIAGEIEVADATTYFAWMKRGEPLCPKCGQRPALVESSGFCRPCHLRLYDDAVEYAMECKAAQRDNDRRRQRRHRSKVKGEA